MAGIDSQETGDHAQRLLLAGLGRDFTPGVLTPDLGEDLWIEYRGFQSAKEGTTPLRGLLQSRGTTMQSGTALARDIELKHIRRWAAQPLPVFVVGVATQLPVTFYAKSIDAILREDLDGKDPMLLPQQKVRVHLPAVADLPGFLKNEIAAHYQGAQLILGGLDEKTIEHDHFEILERREPHGGELVPVASWKILWKSTQRPQHLMAVLRELARRAQSEHESLCPRPAFVVFHIYRSLADRERNLATARVDWIDPSRPRSDDIIRILGAPGNFRMRYDDGVDERREFLRSLTATAQGFLAFANRLGSAFDELTDIILAAEPSLDFWDESRRAQFDVLDELWNKGPFAPTEHAQLNKILEKHYDALAEHYHLLVVRPQLGDPLPVETTRRLLTQTCAKLRDCRGAWRLFLPTL